MGILNLRHLPSLTTVEYRNNTPAIEEVIDFSEIGSIGFAKVTTLNCSARFPSLHINNIASLFPSVAFSTIQPDSVKTIQLNCCEPDDYEVQAGVNPIHKELLRFKNLSNLDFFDSRVFDFELVDALIGLKLLDSLFIDEDCKISFDLVRHLLFRLKARKRVERFRFCLDLEMEEGESGETYKDGAEPVMKNGILVPGVGWKKPIWNVISREEAEELIELAKEVGVKFYGTILNAIKVEKAFEKEVKWLEDVMDFMRNGKQSNVQVRDG